MAAIGAGYDLSVFSFSPDGRVFQVEYAAKAVDNGATSVGLVCSDGILFAVEKLRTSKMAVAGTAPRIFAVDRHATIAIGGFAADARKIVSCARSEASEYRRVYGESIPGRVLSERLALFMHAYTLAWSERPFGAAILLGVCDEEDGVPQESQSVASRFSLYSIDTAGVCFKYFGTALGKGRQIARTEIEKLNRTELTCREALVPVAKMMRRVHDETREREMELEMAWITQESQFQHVMLPREVVDEALKTAEKEIEEEDKEDDASENNEETEEQQPSGSGSATDDVAMTPAL